MKLFLFIIYNNDNSCSQDNEAGRTVRSLIKEEWTTYIAHSLEGETQTNEFRAFYGRFDVSIENDGETIWRDTVDLQPGRNVDIAVALPLNEVI